MSNLAERIDRLAIAMGGGDLLCLTSVHYADPCDPALLQEPYSEHVLQYWIAPNLKLSFCGGNRQTKAAALGRLREEYAAGTAGLDPALVKAYAQETARTRAVGRPVTPDPTATANGGPVAPPGPVRPLSEEQ